MHPGVKVERILFIAPPNITFGEYVSPAANVKRVQKANGQVVGSVITDIPLGPISLSAYLKKHSSVITKLIDFNVALNREASFDFKSFKEYFRSYLSNPDVERFQPTIIGISALFAPSYQSFLDIADCCRQIFPEAQLVGGGNLPTTSYNEILRDTDSFDAICYGEGEKPMLALLEAPDRPVYLQTSSSWMTREKALQKHGFHHDFISDLDEIPFLDYDLLDLEGYSINPTMHYYTSGSAGLKGIPMMTSRGCPFRCIFCAAHRTHGREMRYHSVAKVIEDARKLQISYGAETIILLDDHFMGDPQRAYEIVDALSGLGLTLFFPNALALYALDRKFLELLSRVGVTQLILAVESGSDRVLKQVMHKPLKLDIVRRVIADCRELGIYTDCNILIGLPGETQKDISESRAFLKTINADWFRINVATPLTGSEMYDICEEKHYFKDLPILGNYKKAIIETEDFTAAYIQEISYLMNIELNFVHNANMRLGNYETALESFRNVLKAKHDHPIALYYSGVCHLRLGNGDQSRTCFELAEDCARRDKFWHDIIDMFEIPIFQTTAIDGASA
jgi:anaerobic magnesium-protoporphyrin IX monomethyl ester cyclase